MARDCLYSLGTSSGRSQWQLTESGLTVTPDGQNPLAYPLRELRGIAGDGYELRLAIPGPADSNELLTLSRLGAEGPTLLDTLRRRWMVERADGLRLGGSGVGKPFSGVVAGLGASSGPGVAADAVTTGAHPFHALLYEDVMVIALEGRDLEPIFMALLDDVSFDDVTYTVRAREWLGHDVLFSKLGRQTEEFSKALAANRALLAQESAATLAVNVPSLPTGARTSLAAMWPLGRLLELDAMERACPGFDKTFSAAWLAALPRRQEADLLKDRASAGSVRLGCSRFDGEPAGADTASEPAGQVAATDGSPPESTATAEPSTAADALEPATPDMTGAADGTALACATPAASAEGTLLWMLCGKAEHWFLESLSSGDRATYHFKGGPEMVSLVSKLLCAPQFSREALYLSLDSLVGKRAELSIAAQYLGFLVDLRSRFAGRIIHTSHAAWSAGISAAVGNQDGG